MMLTSRISLSVAITFFFISPGSSFFSTSSRITNVWHPDLVRTEYIAPRTLSRGFVPIAGPTIHRALSPYPFYAPSLRPVFAPLPLAPLPLAPLPVAAAAPAPEVPATEAPTVPPPPPTTTEAVTTTTAAATTVPPPPPPTTTLAPVEVETAAPPAIEEVAAPELVEAPAPAPVAPQVITLQQPAAQGGFPQGIIAVQPIITHGGFLNVGAGGISAPGGITQFPNFLGAALLQALMSQQAAPAAPATEAPATTIAPETTAAPTTTQAPPAPVLPSVHVLPVSIPNIVQQPPQLPQLFQHQPFLNQKLALPQISPADDQKFLIRVDEARANGINQEKRNLRYDGQNDYGYAQPQNYNQYAHESASYGQQQVHPVAEQQQGLGHPEGHSEGQHVYSNQVHGAGGQFDYSYTGANHHSRGSRKY